MSKKKPINSNSLVEASNFIELLISGENYKSKTTLLPEWIKDCYKPTVKETIDAVLAELLRHYAVENLTEAYKLGQDTENNSKSYFEQKKAEKAFETLVKDLKI